MAILRMTQIRKFSDKERAAKLTELKMELLKSVASTSKSNKKIKEIKRTIAKIKTHNRSLLGDGGKSKR